MSEDPDESDDRSGDPFEALGESVGDRDGDPFERLDADDETAQREPPDLDPEQDAKPDPHPQSEPETEPGQPFDPERFGVEPDPTDEPEETPADSDGSEMSFGIGHRESPETESGPSFSASGDREGDPFGGVDSAFAEMDVEKLDPDSVWQELTSAQSRGSVGDARKRTYAEVSKHAYCEQCEHFSDPPDIHCTHEGTEIVEFLDMETVRVVDCPVVAEREKLEEGNHDGKD